MTTVLSPIEFDHLVQVVRHRPAATGQSAGAAGTASGATTTPPPTKPARITARSRPAARWPRRRVERTVGPAGRPGRHGDVAGGELVRRSTHTRRVSQTQYREGGERLAGVRLLVYCDSTPALIRVAELLGEPVAAAEPDRYGTRWQRAVRRFGRVEIDAYRETDPEDEPTP